MDVKERGLGSYLQKAREIRGLSLDELARETKIRKAFLEALENEDWESLPAEIYVKGYLRCYAEALGLDPLEVLRRFDAVKPPKLEEHEFHETKTSRPSRYGLWVIIALVIVIMILLVSFILK